MDGDGDREESMKKAAKDKKEKDKKKDESFDPRMEPSKKDLAINYMMDGDFEAAGGVLGGSEQDIMDEWNEYCSMRGLDRKDALNDIDHVENVVDEMMSSMDDKDFPYEMESLEEDNGSELSQAYDKVYAMTDKPRSNNPEIGMGDDALDQMERYAPKFSDALEKYGDIESIEEKDPANVQDYIKELEYVLFQMEESVNLEELNRMRHLAGLEEKKYNFGADFQYDDEDGYDVNFNLWYQENSAERRAYGEKPYSQEEGEKVFQDMMKQSGIDIFKQKQLSLAKKMKREKESREKYAPEPEQKMMDF